MSGSDSDSEVLYDFTLVEFVTRGRKRKIKQIDIVPTKWIEFSKQRGRLITKFPENSSHPEDGTMLHTLVKNLVDAPEDWPIFSVLVKGRAQTYAKALKKLNRLENETSVLTAGSGEETDEAQQKIVNSIKRSRILNNLDKLKKQLSPDNTLQTSANQNNCKSNGKVPDSLQVSTESEDDDESDDKRNKKKIAKGNAKATGESSQIAPSAAKDLGMLRSLNLPGNFHTFFIDLKP